MSLGLLDHRMEESDVIVSVLEDLGMKRPPRAVYSHAVTELKKEKVEEKVEDMTEEMETMDTDLILPPIKSETLERVDLQGDINTRGTQSVIPTQSSQSQLRLTQPASQSIDHLFSTASD